MERKLAHIEIINDIYPIVGADKIEVARVLGWECVVKKGSFKIGDKIIYVEVDSVMPEKPEYEFLRERKFRVRTIKLRGQISQGLVLPILQSLSSGMSETGKFEVGDDVTELLGIKKYLTPTEASEFEAQTQAKHWTKNYAATRYLMKYPWFRKSFGPAKKEKGYPSFVSKTDEERIQSMPQIVEQFKDYEVYVTEKVDYQSGTWASKHTPLFKIFSKKEFIVTSRNIVNNNKNSLYWIIALKYNLEKICKSYKGNFIIQGEQGNTNVQGNKYKISEPTMWVFNVIHNGYHYNYEKMKGFCDDNNLNCVPLVKICDLAELGSTVQELVEFSKGKSLINPDIEREGVVIRCIKDGKKILSFKVINPNFLLAHEN